MKLLPASIGLFLLLSLMSFSTLFHGGWDLKKDKNGIKVYTRSVEGYKLKEFKGVVRIKTTMAQAKSVLMRISSYTTWQHNVSTAKIVGDKTSDQFYAYVVTNAPWPVSDREVVVKNDIEKGTDGSVTFHMNAVTGKGPQNTGNVTMTYMKGFWKLTPMGDGTVEVIQQVHADPAGNIPDWLSNSAVVDTPYKTLYNLKQKLE